MMRIETIIVGAGIVGLAIARQLTAQGKEVLVIEANAEVGQDGSFRNSAVIHAGIYYPRNSLKAKFCLRGKELLYDYCKKNKIAHQKIGKLIVATNEDQLKALKEFAKKAEINQVQQLELLSKAEAQSLEPHLECNAALYSPTTGIVNGKELIESLKNDVEELGGKFLFTTKFQCAKFLKNEFDISISNPLGITKIKSNYLINTAGLGAIDVAQNIDGLAKKNIPMKYFAKGNYFKYKKQNPFSKLIYPIPESAGLGIHATIDLTGQLRFGPDVEWIESIDYRVNPDRRNSFVKAIAVYFPEIKAEDLQAEFSGIRPKIIPPDEQPQDFLIQDEKVHGVKGLINLYGIESPGLTSALAIAEYVASIFNKSLK